MMEANKNSTKFKYNNNPVYGIADFAFSIINSRNFLTINFTKAKLIDVIISPEDIPLIDIQ